jgi:hypothetical protein
MEELLPALEVRGPVKQTIIENLTMWQDKYYVFDHT